MYIHVPMAWLAMGGYAASPSARPALVWRHPLADLACRELSPVGAAVTALCLATGSLWGKPMWGTWWVWDARLTRVLVLFFLWLGHAALVRAFDDAERGARMGAILALVGAVNLPVVKFSVDWWNTLHQPASVTRIDAPALHVDILYPLLVCALGFTLAFAALVLARTRAAVMERRIRALQMAAARRAEAGWRRRRRMSRPLDACRRRPTRWWWAASLLLAAGRGAAAPGGAAAARGPRHARRAPRQAAARRGGRRMTRKRRRL